MTSSNPVARLHTILEEITSAAAHVPIGTVWAAVLGLSGDDEDRPMLLQGVASFMALPAAAAREVTALPDDGTKQLMLQWRAPVQASLPWAHRFEQQVANFSNPLTGNTLFSLQVAAAKVEHAGPQLELNSDGVSDANRLIGELLDVLTASADLDPAARAMLVRHASALQRALRLVAVVGPEGVQEALVDAYAALNLVANGHPEDDERSGGKKFLAVIGHTAAFITIAGESLQIAAAVQQLLLGA